MEKHTKNIMESELKQKQLLEERQQVFEAAFKNDLTMYKQCGELPSKYNHVLIYSRFIRCMKCMCIRLYQNF